jgi:predicted AAA+ superfamily ATPase
MNYIKRDLEQKVLDISREYVCLLLTGPRQVGKTTLLKRLTGAQRGYVTLDDLEERNLAKNDSALFFQLHPLPLLIDEVQYAPELFSHIKIMVDEGAPAGSVWMTGSQAFRLMELARESLAGRMAILHMPPLSQHEIFGSGENKPFTVNLKALQARAALMMPAELKGIYERIWKGAMPGLVSGKYTDRDVFYAGYLETYIQRDLSDLLEPVDKLLFHDFVRAAASRAGQMLNVHDIAGDVGVSDDTARRWLRVLEASEIIFYLRPYANNLIKRTVKAPKLYFFDTGLVAYLTRYSSPEILASGAINGAILENYVVCEIIKTWRNEAKDCPLWYYRDSNQKEIDLIMEDDGKLFPMKIKRSINPGTELTRAFRVLDKSALLRGEGAILCMRPDLSAIDSMHFIVPIWMI